MRTILMFNNQDFIPLALSHPTKTFTKHEAPERWASPAPLFKIDERVRVGASNKYRCQGRA
jgi:hypothetical protein